MKFDSRQLLRDWMMFPLFCSLVILPAAAKAGEKNAPVSEHQIRQRTESFVKALQKGDPKAIASFWTTGGEYSGGNGVSIRGRSEVEQAYKELFAKVDAIEVDLDIETVRFLSKNTAVAQGTFQSRRGGEDETRSSGFSILFVLEEGQWQFGVLREWDKSPALSDLKWLLGNWSYKNEDAEVSTSYRMSEDAKCMLMRFQLHRGKENSTGMQMIVLDPSTDTIRSWSVGGDGGIGQGAWEFDGKRWLVSRTGVTPEGEEMTSTSIITPVDKDSFTWQAVTLTPDGKEKTEVGPITIKRVAEAE